MGSVVSGAIGGVLGDTIGGLTGGLANTNKYQASTPQFQMQDFAAALAQAQQGGQDVTAKQNALAAALQAQAATQPPNLAQAQLNNATGQNVQQQAALMASARGANANAGLMARQVANQGAQIQQDAAGQAATLAAHQQLAEQQRQLAISHQLGGLYGTMGEQNVQRNQILQNANSNQAQNVIHASLGAQGINAGVAGQNSAQQYAMNSGLLSSASGGLMKSGSSGGSGGGVSDVDLMGAANGGNQGGGQMTGLAGGGEASMGEAAMVAAHGALVPGKARVSGDSTANDTKPYMLSPGEVVVPRTLVSHPDKVKAFIEHLKQTKTKGTKIDGPKGYAAVLESHRKLEARIKALEAKKGK